jgi:uncharacterized protein (TIGR03435 family)
MMRSLLPATVVLLAVVTGFSQTPGPKPAFEVATIKPAPPMTMEAMRAGKMHLGAKIDQGRADFGGMPLKDLIARAYRVKAFQISGPDWITSSRFDVLAKLPEGASVESVPEMLRALLEDRFLLKVHTDTKEFPVYALIVDKNGQKLTPKPADYAPEARTSTRPMTMEAYASLLNIAVDRPVVDLTEIKGEYLISMDVIMRTQMAKMRAQAEQQASAMSGRAPADAAGEPSNSDVFTALREMGLKLEARKLPLPLLVVDHAEKTPTEN